MLLDRIQVNIEKRDSSGLEDEEILQVLNFKKDIYIQARLFMTKDIPTLDAYFEDVASKTSRMNLKSYDFESDPDCRIKI